jgi:hypothetical protein
MAGCAGGAGSRIPLGRWLAGPTLVIRFKQESLERSHFKRQLKQNEILVIQESNPFPARLACFPLRQAASRLADAGCRIPEAERVGRREAK